jgi:hypothetical protein
MSLWEEWSPREETEMDKPVRRLCDHHGLSQKYRSIIQKKGRSEGRVRGCFQRNNRTVSVGWKGMRACRGGYDSSTDRDRKSGCCSDPQQRSNWNNSKTSSNLCSVVSTPKFEPKLYFTCHGKWVKGRTSLYLSFPGEAQESLLWKPARVLGEWSQPEATTP